MTQVILLDTDLLRDQVLFQRARDAMSPARREKLERFRFETDRRLSLGVGVALDRALAAHGLRERELDWALGPQGKPFFPARPELCFNLSHGGHYAVCALSQREVGVDVQPVGQVGAPLIGRVCTPGEAESLLALDQGARNERFFYLWTVKESYMKLLGLGLRLDPRRLELGFRAPETIGLDGVPQAAFFAHWSVDGHWLSLCAGENCCPRLRVLTREELEDCYG